MRCRYNNMRFLSHRELSAREPSRLPGPRNSQRAFSNEIISRDSCSFRRLRRYRRCHSISREGTLGRQLRETQWPLNYRNCMNKPDLQIVGAASPRARLRSTGGCTGVIRVYKCTRTHAHVNTIALLVESSHRSARYPIRLITRDICCRIGGHSGSLCPLIRHVFKWLDANAGWPTWLNHVLESFDGAMIMNPKNAFMFRFCDSNVKSSRNDRLFLHISYGIKLVWSILSKVILRDT